MATQQIQAPQAAARMTDAAKAFVGSLDDGQKAKAIYEYMDGERVFWYYPPMNRHGLALRDMEPAQRELAMAVMASGLTPESYEQAKLIMEHEDVLGPLEKERGITSFLRDTELYYFTIFGEPGGDGPWAWRAEGHHISIHFSIWADKVIGVTPFFFGANPAEVRKGPKNGLRILGAREDLAFDLMESLDEKQVEESIICDAAPADIVTFNSSKASLMTYEGLPAAKMNGAQKELLMAVVAEYVNQVNTDVAEQKLADLKKTGLDHLYWAWAGPVTKDEPHYYRIHGGDFVVEFDNRQDGANHIHSVWRDVENDFAADVLREHLILYHVI